MPTSLSARLLVLLLALVAPTRALAAVPLQVVEDSLSVPEGMDAEEALAAVEDLPAIFANFHPVVPKVPGLRLDLTKELVSAEIPVVMAMPVDGAAFGRSIEEQARVTATTEPMLCDSGRDGLRVHLAFEGSSRNVYRRIDRIEITACPRDGDDGALFIDATGSLYEGALPLDPALNGLQEKIGAKAIQTAFIKQVPAVFDAVEHTWMNPGPPPV